MKKISVSLLVSLSALLLGCETNYYQTTVEAPPATVSSDAGCGSATAAAPDAGTNAAAPDAEAAAAIDTGSVVAPSGMETLLLNVQGLTLVGGLNKRLVFVKTSGGYNAETYGGEVSVYDLRDGSSRVVTKNGAGPAVNEDGLAAWAEIDVGNRCATIMTEAWGKIMDNCDGTDKVLPQLTQISYRGQQVLFTIKSNSGTGAYQNALYQWDGAKRLLIARAPDDDVLLPTIQGDEFGFMRFYAPPSGKNSDAVIMNMSDGSNVFTVVGNLPTDSIVGFAFNKLWFAYTMEAADGSQRSWLQGRQNNGVMDFPAGYPILNDEGTIVLWGITGVIRYYAIGTPFSGTITGYDSIYLEGNDLFYISKGQLFVYHIQTK